MYNYFAVDSTHEQLSFVCYLRHFSYFYIVNKTVIIEAAIDQIPVIQQLAKECFPVAYVGIHSEEQNLYMMEKMYGTESLVQQMTEGHSCFLLLYLDGEPAGYCAYKPHATEENTIYLDKLYILPSLKGKGLGRLLVERVMDAAKSLHPQGYTIKLDVNRSNTAKAFYEHLGFSVVRSWDAPIGNGFFMNGYEMKLSVTDSL